MRSWVLGLVAALFALFVASRASAAPALDIDASTTQATLAGHVDVLEDETAKLSYDDVQTPDVAARFRLNTAPLGPNFGFTRSAIWARFTLHNRADVAVERWLAIDHVPLEVAELYVDREPMRVAGRNYPRSARELPRRSYTFRLVVPAHGERTVYLRSYGESELQLPLELWEQGALAAHDTNTATWGALAFGIMLALALYNAFLYFFVREVTHLLYAAQVVSSVTWIACLDGTLLEALPGSVEELPDSVIVLTGYAAVAFSQFFARRLLDIRAVHPRLDRALVVGVWVLAVLMVAFLAGLANFRDVNRMSTTIILPLLFCVFGIALERWRAGSRVARWLALSWGALLALVVVAVAAVNGFVSIRVGLLPHAAYATEAILLSLALADAARQRNDHVARLHAASGRFVPYEFLALLGKRELPEVKQGDQVERQMTTFFLDVRAFTTLVEGLTPQQAIAFVNEVFGRMEQPISEHHGVIDKFIGDAVMALFERADDAVAAAVGCLEALGPYNAERARDGRPAVAVGIGLHTGELMLGTVGGGQRLSCTVIGDSVNLASRIEGMTKTFGASILMSDDTRRALGDAARFETRCIGRVAAKGKSEPVLLHEILDGLDAGVRAARLATRDDLDAGCASYLRGDFAAARAAFERCLARSPDDGTASVYVGLCDELTAEAPAGDWDGAIRLASK